MIKLRIGEAAAACGGNVLGDDVVFSGVGTDTRDIAPGTLFVALRGPRFDGHDFIDHARRAGAVAALVERDFTGAPLPLLRVADTRAALGRLAAYWRARFAVPVVGVTGSNGKTTVKEMLRAILATAGPVLATRGNLNNDIGVPLTLLGLDAGHCHAVIELGANHPGEIAALAGMACPRVGVVTLCAPAHLEGFGSVEGVARAKGELFAALPDDGVAVVNADDPYAPLWRELAAPRRVLSFALDAAADVTARWSPVPGGMRLHVGTPAGAIDTELVLAGRHNACNALAASAAALALDTPLVDIAAGLAAVTPVKRRLQPRRGPRGCLLIDDTYNANPASLAAALEVLAGSPRPHWLVLGDMRELGRDAARYHAEAGALARAAGVERLWATGELSRATVRDFGAGARHFADRETLAEALLDELPAGATVLVKGSLGSHMETVAAALAAAGERSPCC